MRLLLVSPRVRLVAIAVIAGALFVPAAIFLPHTPGAMRHAVAGSGWAAPLLFVMGWAALTPALFSGSILAAVGGLLFGPVLGTVLGTAGATLGGLASFILARRLGASAFAEMATERIRRVEDRVESCPLRSLLLLRLMPGMPVTWLNYAVGLTKVRARTFALANTLGGAPRTFIYASLGGSLSHASPVVTVISAILFVGLGGAGAIGVILDRRITRASAVG